MILNLKLGTPACARKLTALVVASVLMASCGGGGSAQSGPAPTNNSSAGSASGTPIPPPTPTSPANTLAILVDAGPTQIQSTNPQINIAYVTVTVCAPGTSPTTAACQTIDHVALDTGSSGLRLLKSELYSSLNLPQVTSTGGAIGECAPFVIGTTWGSVRYADIYLNGEVARNVPFQDIGDTPGGYSTVPYDCSGTGMIQNTQSSMGSNGILGIGLFQNDCELCQTEVISATYYTCNTGGCTNSAVTATQVVQNPVADFAPANNVTDNNGTQISLPLLSSSGYSTSSINGILTFGIGTQLNNQLGSATVYATDSSGNITTTFNGTTMTGSYIDSGSNALFFNDASITPPCAINTWAYCPSSQLNLFATNVGANESTGQVSFSIVNADALSPGVDVAANIGGPYCISCTGVLPEFDWGLPFFFGKSVFTGIQGVTPPTGVPAGPYFAY